METLMCESAGRCGHACATPAPNNDNNAASCRAMPISSTDTPQAGLKVPAAWTYKFLDIRRGEYPGNETRKCGAVSALCVKGGRVLWVPDRFHLVVVDTLSSLKSVY